MPWKPESFFEVPKVTPAPEVSEEGVKSVYLEGPAFQGRPTKVFAFYGLPAGASAERKVPGIVLLHGGGGTAFARWVRLWNSRGYAAIAIDHFGNLPLGKANAWQRNPHGGPNIDGGARVDEPLGDQWMYHAVANTMLAHSLLRSLPEVDAERTGLTGISWGGVIASTVSGLDARFKFVVPIYGCGFISDASADDGSRYVGGNLPPEKAARWRALWDPANYLPRSDVPMLWVTGTNDFAFTLRALQLSHREARGPHSFSFRVEMTHGQQVGESPEEVRVFADSIVNGGRPLVRVLASGVESGKAWVKCEPAAAIKGVELIYTRYPGTWQNRKWETLPAAWSSDGRADIQLPKGVRACFFNITDDRGLIVSSDPDLAVKKYSITQ